MIIKRIVTAIFKLPFLPVIVSPILLLSSVILTGKALFWGTPSLQFIPWWVWSFDSILDGRFPLWNPLLGMGSPLIANYQSALFYPFNWLYFISYVIGDVPLLSWMQAVLLTIHLIIAGIGMVVLTKRLGLSRLAQTVSGLAFSLSGYLVARAWFASINAAAAWLPWILLFTYDLSQENNRFKNVLKFGLVIGIQLLAGHAQTSWYTLLLAFAWYWFWTYKKGRNNNLTLHQRLRKSGKDWGFLGAGILLGVSIASVQLIPTMEYLLNSQRASAVEYKAAMTYSMWPWRLLGLIGPNFFGSPAHGNYWGYGNYWEDAIYIGMLPFILSFSVFIKTILRRIKETTKRFVSRRVKNNHNIADRKLVFSIEVDRVGLTNLPIFLFAIGIISIILALGDNTPIYPWLYNHVPTFDAFHSPTRFSIWLIFSLSITAAIGIDNWKQPKGKALYWTRLATAGAFAVILGGGIGWLLLRDVVQNFRPTFVTALLWAGLLGMGSGVLSLTKPEHTSQNKYSYRRWQWGFVFWLCIDLIIAGWGLNPGIDITFYTNDLPSIDQIRELVGDGRVYLSEDDEYDLKYNDFFGFKTFEPSIDWRSLRASLLPNLNMLDDILYVNNYDPLVPEFYAVWMEALETSQTGIKNKVLDFMAVSLIEQRSETSKHGVQFIERGTFQRVRWVPCQRSITDHGEALNLIFSGEVNLRAEVLIVSAKDQKSSACYVPDFFPEITSDNGNRITVSVNAPSDGWLVLADTWYPGWKASIDGEVVDIEKANYAFKAVKVPEGIHQVTFVYRPFSFIFGGLISAFSISTIGFISLMDRIKHKR